MRTTRNPDERGATAIIVAALATAVLVIAAFVVDFGMAYVSKRQLQTAADSAALAAAGYFADKIGTCATLVQDTAATAEAEALAAYYVEENRPGATVESVDLGCNAFDQLTVDVEVSATTPGTFGTLAGIDEIATARTAEATLDVPQTAGIGLRPWGLCSAQVPSSLTPSRVVAVSMPANGHRAPPGCPTADVGGNWWLMDCPEAKNGSTGATERAIREGCSTPVRTVPRQPQHASAAALGAFLKAQCSADSTSCLSADTGQNLNWKIQEAWNTLLGETIVVPVFCAEPICAISTHIGLGGSKARFPLYKFAAVTVCGYSFSGDSSSDTLPAGDCRTRNTFGLKPSQFNKKDNGFLLVFRSSRTSDTTDSSSCGLGSDCDGGLRRTLLTN